MFYQAKPIFPKGKQFDLNTLASFRTTTGSLKGAELHITAATFYQLWINGKFVALGPARTAQGYARVDVHSLDAFDAEKNEILILVESYNVRSLSTVRQPGYLLAEVQRDTEVLAATGKDFEAFLPSCKIQKTERYSCQRHFSEIWDFRDGKHLTMPEEAAEIAIQENGIQLIDRVAPYPRYEDVFVSSASATGTLTVDESLPYHVDFYSNKMTRFWGSFSHLEHFSEPYRWVQQTVQNKQTDKVELPVALDEMEYAIIDLGRLETGFVMLSVEAETDADLVVAFSEDCAPDKFAYTNMHVHNILEFLFEGGAAKDAMTFEPYTMRYVLLAARKGKLSVRSFGIKTFENDISALKIPTLEDKTLESIYRGALRTYAHNAVDIYTDCPSRERAGWLCDSYFTAKTEYELFGSSKVESAFLENYRLFRDIDGDYPKGVLPMVFPSDAEEGRKFIPQWNMWYILEVDEYINKRGHGDERELFRESVEGLLDFYSRYINEDGLLERLPSWNFVEWSVANQWTKDVSYPTNFLYAEVLDSAYRLFGNEKLLEQSAHVRKVAVEQSFNGRNFMDHAIRNEEGKLVRCEHASEACQYYAILFGGIDLKEEKYAELYRLVTEVFRADRNGAVPEITEVNAFIGAYLRLEALLKLGEHQLLLRDLKEFFGKMEEETGTLWEYRQRNGSRDHGFASYALVAMNRALEGLKA